MQAGPGVREADLLQSGTQRTAPCTSRRFLEGVGDKPVSLVPGGAADRDLPLSFCSSRQWSGNRSVSYALGEVDLPSVSACCSRGRAALSSVRRRR